MVYKIRNQDLGPCLRALEDKPKERQVENGPGTSLLPNFPMKIKVARFVSTNHQLSIKINLYVYITCGPFNSTQRPYKLKQMNEAWEITGTSIKEQSDLPNEAVVNRDLIVHLFTSPRTSFILNSRLGTEKNSAPSSHGHATRLCHQRHLFRRLSIT